MFWSFRSFAALLGGVWVVLGATNADAKRSAPAEVPAVVVDGVEYRVPMSVDRQGYVDAYASHTSRLLWSRQIYVVLKNAELEGDVQDVFIASVRQDGADKALLIANERGDEYRLDLSSLEVKILKGVVAVRRQK